MEANEHPAMAEKNENYETGMKLANKLVDAIEMYNSLSDEEKEAEAKRSGVDVLAKLKAAHDDIMNRIHDESNYPAQEEEMDEAVDAVTGINPNTGERTTLGVFKAGQGRKIAQDFKSKGATSVQVNAIS